MKTQTSLAGGVLSAIGATACCFGPLLLVTLGFGGAWAARMQALAPLQPVFMGLTLVFVGFAFHQLYIRPRQCAPGEVCEAPHVLKRQRVAFWIVVALIVAMTLVPFFAPLLY
jgi:mercuric ion transport protein